MKNKNIFAIILAFVAASFYSISTPISKILLNMGIESTMMASILYLGAGFGMMLIFIFTKQYKKDNLLEKSDLKYTILMVLLDIAAPIFLMIGLSIGKASTISLLNNFEIVATTIIAYSFFKEKISPKLLIGIILITIASIILSYNGAIDINLKSALFAIMACICWGIENNCTKSISSKNNTEIVMIKGIFSGFGSLLISFLLHENLPEIIQILEILLLGFISYGLSIFFYVKAQSIIGASKVSAYYAVNPFIGSILSFFILKETLLINYYFGLVIMILGSIFVILDTLSIKNES